MAYKTEDGDDNGVNDVSADLIEEKEVDAVLVENYSSKCLIYGVNDTPPIHVTIICALQQSLASMPSHLIISLLVAQAVCASSDDTIKARLVSNSFFMSGFTTLIMNIFGVRLPLFQGASSEYAVPLLLVAGVDDTFCSSLSSQDGGLVVSSNVTANTTITEEKIYHSIQALSGSLMVAGIVQALLGFTGLIGILLKYIGPITIVTTLLLLFVNIIEPVITFIEVQWGVAMSTVAVTVILSIYLGNHDLPIPVWTPSSGFHVIRYPLHQVFALLISITFNWMLCGLLTYFNVFPDNPKHPMYKSRTDARLDVIKDSPWAIFIYPGQFGPFGFSGPAFLSCMIAAIISTLDSIGDYYACARAVRVPMPPKHAVNRGILMEGLCSFISGTMGCGHGTASYGENIGAIRITKVASRSVFVCVGILYMLFGIFGKFSAFFITIPHPVLGGAVLVMLGIFAGVALSNLEVIKLSSTRNMAIIGLSLAVGLVVPKWARKQSMLKVTGLESIDRILATLLCNVNLVGTIIAFTLDNTVTGTDGERGITAWQVSDQDENDEVDKNKFDQGYEVYQPVLPSRLLSSRYMKYFPFMPYRRIKSELEQYNGNRLRLEKRSSSKDNVIEM